MKNIEKLNDLTSIFAKELGNLNALAGMKAFTKEFLNESEFARIDKQIDGLKKSLETMVQKDINRNLNLGESTFRNERENS